MRLALCAIFALLFPLLALAEPEGVNRVVRSINFEERELGNSEDLPMHWVKLESPQMPHYVEGKLSTVKARSGKYSFEFNLDGGSAVYRYQPGLIKVRRGAHYHVECYVMTTPMEHARARMTAYLLDQDGHEVAGSRKHSELYSAQNEYDDWHALTIELTADDQAESMVLELELLQPELYTPTTLGKAAIFPQDIHGTAWFDDLVVAQVPKVKLSTDRPGNIFRRDDKLVLSVNINDRFTDDLTAQLVITDATGRVVYQRSGALDMALAAETAQGEKILSLNLPELSCGWYEASLLMTSHGQSLGNQKIDLVKLADNAISDLPDDRFGINAVDLPFEGWSELPSIMPFIPAGRVKLGVWSRAGDIQKIDSAAFDRLLVKLQEQHITPTACLLELPPDLAKKAGGSGWASLSNLKDDDWQSQLSFLIARHANHLDRWQLGADGDDEFVSQPKAREAYSTVYAQFAQLVQQPDLAMPWPAWVELDGKLPATVALAVPGSVLPSQIPLYMEDIARHPGHNLALSLELLDADKYGREMQIRDLAQRVVYALSAGANRIDLPLPFSVRREEDHLVKEPKELLLVVRTLTTVLGGASFKGKVPIADGVEAFLFERDGQSVLALWNRSGEKSSLPLSLNLGDKPRQIDLWGNVTPLLQSAEGKQSGKVTMSVGPMPVFLTDIDGYLAQWRASVGIDQPLIESSFTPHTRHIHFTNPYRQAVSGQLKLTGPAGWTISPPTMTFNLNPCETFDRPITIEFPYSSYAGPKTIMAQFTIQSDHNSTLSVPITLTLGLSDVGLQSLAIRDGNEVMVQQIITNYGEKPIDYTAFAIYPGQARQERLVTNLAPGKTTIKRYRFTRPENEKPSPVRVGIKQIDGTRILNDQVGVQ